MSATIAGGAASIMAQNRCETNCIEIPSEYALVFVVIMIGIVLYFLLRNNNAR